MSYILIGQIEGLIVQHDLKNGEIHIGREPDNDIILNHKTVSRYHAIIQVDGNQICIRDLGSSNGTFVNGHEINQLTAINTGDKIKFSEPEFILNYSDSPTFNDSATQLVYFEPDKINAEEIIRLEEVQDHLSGPTTIVDKRLFWAVAEAGKLLIGSHSVDEIFEAVLDIVEEVIPARRILLIMGNSSNKAPEIRATRSSKQSARKKLMLSKTIIDTVYRDRKALLLSDALSDPLFQEQHSIIMQNIHSAMVAPLFDNEDVIGLLYADSDDIRLRYDRNQLQAFTLLANLIAIKITNAKLLEAQRIKERMEQEMKIAMQVQQSLLYEIPTVPGYEILAWQISCLNVCGDLYDVASLSDGRIAIVLGDVTGKGMPAALLMSNVLASLRILYQECPPLKVLVERLHKQLYRSSDAMYFATLFVGFLDLESGILEYINAGHNAPLVVHDDGKTLKLDSTGLPIGLLDEETKYEINRVQLREKSLLSVYSDGITETMNNKKLFGENNFIQGIKKRFLRSLKEIKDGLEYDLNTFRGENPFIDDVTLLLLRRRKESDPFKSH